MEPWQWLGRYPGEYGGEAYIYAGDGALGVGSYLRRTPALKLQETVTGQAVRTRTL